MKIDRYYYWRVISVVFTMMLQILPLPLWAHMIWPQWVLLGMIAWLMLSPRSFSMPAVFTVGLLMDLLTGTPLGLHAFSYTLCAYVVVRLHRQIQHFPLWQQALFIGLCVFFNALVILLVLLWVSDTPSAFMLLSALSSLLLWPWMAHVFNITWRDHTPRYT